eukprot:7422765-Pyramimonas_sp.AAC.1
MEAVFRGGAGRYGMVILGFDPTFCEAVGCFRRSASRGRQRRPARVALPSSISFRRCSVLCVEREKLGESNECALLPPPPPGARAGRRATGG